MYPITFVLNWLFTRFNKVERLKSNIACDMFYGVNVRIILPCILNRKYLRQNSNVVVVNVLQQKKYKRALSVCNMRTKHLLRLLRFCYINTKKLEISKGHTFMCIVLRTYQVNKLSKEGGITWTKPYPQRVSKLRIAFGLPKRKASVLSHG